MQTDSQPPEFSNEHWDPDPDARRKRLEAVLFMARGPISSRKLSQFAGLEDGTQARTLIKELNQNYEKNGRAFLIKRIAGGYQLLTRPQFSKWIRQLDHIQSPKRLSRPAMETLTVVAYRQPVIKADIEAIRGVACGEMLRQLLEQGYIRISGRSDELGRPFLYSTTKEFLQEFGLRSQDELPRAEALVGQGLPNWHNSDQISGPSQDSTQSNNDSTEAFDSTK